MTDKQLLLAIRKIVREEIKESKKVIIRAGKYHPVQLPSFTFYQKDLPKLPK